PGVAAEGRHQGEPATFEEIFDDERVAADVVLAQHVDLEFTLDRPLGLADDMLEELVVGDVVSGRLADTLVALATEAEDIDAQGLLHLAGHGMNVVADQSDRTGGADRDRPGLEDLVGLKDGLLELLLAAEDDLLFLHVGGQRIRHVVFGAQLIGHGLVAPRQPAIIAAADWPVGDLEDVARGPEHHALAAGISAAALGDDAWNGPGIGADYWRRLGIIGEDLGLALAAHFFRIDLQQFLLRLRGGGDKLIHGSGSWGGLGLGFSAFVGGPVQRGSRRHFLHFLHFLRHFLDQERLELIHVYGLGNHEQLVGVDLAGQRAVLVGLGSKGVPLDDCFALDLGTLDVVVAGEKVDHLRPQPAGELVDHLAFVVDVAAVADQAPEADAAGLGELHDSLGDVVGRIHRHHLAGTDDVNFLGLALAHGHRESAADDVAQHVVEDVIQVLVLVVGAELLEQVDRGDDTPAGAADSRLGAARLGAHRRAPAASKNVVEIDILTLFSKCVQD